ncbi:Hypothetical predicted protein [Xyrichtys novacula]|uniref:Uncharacterized protein n=1 Tax=Xyrichtys novacula TaxID=13765 RepID=A0AAV1H0I4_XYRNO|nr:Hypothetical predicted protein [Xyrichtys novacula]
MSIARGTTYRQQRPALLETPHRQQRPALLETPHRQQRPALLETPHRQQRPALLETPHRQQRPALLETPHRQQRPALLETPHRQQRPALLETPHRQQRPALLETPYRQQRPALLETPYRLQNYPRPSHVNRHQAANGQYQPPYGQNHASHRQWQAPNQPYRAANGRYQATHGQPPQPQAQNQPYQAQNQQWQTTNGQQRPTNAQQQACNVPQQAPNLQTPTDQQASYGQQQAPNVQASTDQQASHGQQQAPTDQQASHGQQQAPTDQQASHGQQQAPTDQQAYHGQQQALPDHWQAPDGEMYFNIPLWLKENKDLQRRLKNTEELLEVEREISACLEEEVEKMTPFLNAAQEISIYEHKTKEELLVLVAALSSQLKSETRHKEVLEKELEGAKHQLARPIFQRLTEEKEAPQQEIQILKKEAESSEKGTEKLERLELQLEKTNSIPQLNSQLIIQVKANETLQREVDGFKQEELYECMTKEKDSKGDTPVDVTPPEDNPNAPEEIQESTEEIQGAPVDFQEATEEIEENSEDSLPLYEEIQIMLRAYHEEQIRIKREMESVSAWRRFKKLMTPRHRRLYKHQQQGQNQV